MASGIYKFTNKVNGKSYVGSASYLDSRKRTHLRDLRAGTHYNTKFQAAWNKYGAQAFDYSVIELVDDMGLLRAREQHWMDALNVVAEGYNILPKAGSMSNYKHTEETKKKMSAAKMGSVFTEAHKKAISIGKTGAKQTDEQRARQSAFMKSWRMSDEQRAAQLTALRSPEVRAKISATSKGRVFTEEHRKNLRAALARPEVVLKLRNRGKQVTA